MRVIFQPASLLSWTANVPFRFVVGTEAENKTNTKTP